MKVTWYLPALREIVRGVIIGDGPLRVMQKNGMFGTPFIVVQDTKKYYNLCRIEYAPGEYTLEELDILGENYKHIAEIKLSEIRNGHEPTIQNPTDD